jgi:hypothetical protein
MGVLLGSLLTGASFNLALGMMIGNTLEAWVIAYCLKRFADFHPAINRVQDVIRLLTISFFGTMISASFGTMTLMVTGLGSWEYFITIWTTWWIGDLLGALVVAPVLLVWISQPPYLSGQRSYLEGTIQPTPGWYSSSGAALCDIPLYDLGSITVWTARRIDSYLIGFWNCDLGNCQWYGTLFNGIEER